MRTDVTVKLNEIVDWLSFQTDDLSFGLLSVEDAIKLYDYAKANSELPELADSWDKQYLISAIGYDPLS